MNRVKVFASALALSAVIPAAAGQEMGVTVHGESEAPVGLYLMPWGEEPVSDIDRPPQLIDESPQVIDPEEFQRYAQWYQAHRAYRYWRLQRNNW
ncbi:hypothetical protein [Zhongshania sp.]|uniref:hypothetical protein n=1 Tax=Zhongshania sp. TaxID=1971902 RepID=UPI0035657D39